MASGSEFMCRKKVDTHRYFYWGLMVQTELGNHLNMTVSQIQWLEYEYEKKSIIVNQKMAIFFGNYLNMTWLWKRK